MASGSYRRRDVLCPFYRRDNGTDRITCEGITDESILTVHFLRSRSYDTQMDTFCTKHYDRCEINRMLMEKYEEGA